MIQRGLQGLKTIMGLLGSISGGTTQSGPPNKWVVWIRLTARVLLLFMAVYIFLIWPVMDPVAYASWLKMMILVPDEVWYVIWGIIFSWGAIEVTKNLSSRYNYDMNYDSGYDSGYSSHMEEPEVPSLGLDGRFANLDSDDEGLLEPPEYNPVIEEWRNASE